MLCYFGEFLINLESVVLKFSFCYNSYYFLLKYRSGIAMFIFHPFSYT